MRCPACIVELSTGRFLLLSHFVSWTVGLGTTIGIFFFGLPAGSIVVAALATVFVLLAVTVWRILATDAQSSRDEAPHAV